MNYCNYCRKMNAQVSWPEGVTKPLPPKRPVIQVPWGR